MSATLHQVDSYPSSLIIIHISSYLLISAFPIDSFDYWLCHIFMTGPKKEFTHYIGSCHEISILYFVNVGLGQIKNAMAETYRKSHSKTEYLFCRLACIWVPNICKCTEHSLVPEMHLALRLSSISTQIYKLYTMSPERCRWWNHLSWPGSGHEVSYQQPLFFNIKLKDRGSLRYFWLWVTLLTNARAYRFQNVIIRIVFVCSVTAFSVFERACSYTLA